MRLDRKEDTRLKRDLCTLPVDEISPPLLAVQRSMFLPVFGLSNIQKHVELMSWTLRMIRRTLRRKRNDLHHYTYKKSVRYGQGAALGGVTSLPTDCSSTPPTVPSSEHSDGTSEPSVSDLNVNSDYSHSPLPRRIFDIDAHISHLQRDIRQLEELDSNVDAVLGRTVHRVKERLGRRVWSGKDIWLAQDRARVPATKEFWKGAVNFVVPDVTKLRARGQRQTRSKRS